MNAQVNLKLVNADRYSCPLIGTEVIEKGNIVSVSADTADILLADVRTDSLNNEHPVWVQVSDAEAQAPAEDEDSAPVAKAPIRATRTAKK